MPLASEFQRDATCAATAAAAECTRTQQLQREMDKMLCTYLRKSAPTTDVTTQLKNTFVNRCLFSMV